MPENERVPIREDLFTKPLSPADEVRLVGGRCRECGEVSLGSSSVCPNCGRQEIEGITLSNKGQLWTFTVIRNRPPGDYKGPEPFTPFGLGLVELPEGIRVLSPIDCPIEKLRIGMDLELVIHKLYRDGKENDVMAFKFRPA